MLTPAKVVKFSHNITKHYKHSFPPRAQKLLGLICPSPTKRHTFLHTNLVHQKPTKISAFQSMIIIEVIQLRKPCSTVLRVSRPSEMIEPCIWILNCKCISSFFTLATLMHYHTSGVSPSFWSSHDLFASAPQHYE